MKSVNHVILKGYSKLHSFDLGKQNLNPAKQKGATTVEYGLIVAIVVLMVVAASAKMKEPLEGFFTAAVGKVTTFMN